MVLIVNNSIEISQEIYEKLFLANSEYIQTRERNLRNIKEQLKRLHNYSDNELNGYLGEGFQIFKLGNKKPEELTTYFGCVGQYFGDLVNEFGFLDRKNRKELKIGIEKKLIEEISQKKYGDRLNSFDGSLRGEESRFLDTVTEILLGTDYKGLFFFSASGSICYRLFFDKNRNERNFQGHWDYVDDTFNTFDNSANMDKTILERLKTECRIINPEFIPIESVFWTAGYKDISSWNNATYTNKSTRVISWHIDDWPSKFPHKIPKTISIGQYELVYYESDFTPNKTVKEVTYAMLKPNGLVVCKKECGKKYLDDHRFIPIYFNPEGDNSMFMKK